MSDYPVNEEFKRVAAEIYKDKGTLCQRLNAAKSCLTTEFRKAFDDCTFEPEQQRLVSGPGKHGERYALQWTNDGKTRVGSVTLVALEFAVCDLVGA